MIIGIRRADKNKWERRVPLIPSDIKELKEKFGITAIIQPSEIRAFNDDEYIEAGAEVTEDINKADVIFDVKEIPLHFYRPNKTYIFFSHTIKGQAYNMPLLKKMMELKCSLIDYERIVDESNRRLIFFGKFAGIAGMVETLHSLGQKLKLKGLHTPFENIKKAYEYPSIQEAINHLKVISDQIKSVGLDVSVLPLVIGLAGYGNVSKGAQEILDIFPVKTLKTEELKTIDHLPKNELKRNIFKVVFEEKDLVVPKEGVFELQDYYNHPEKYSGKFEEYIPYLTVLVNCIFWTDKYPRLVTKEYLWSDDYRKSSKKMIIIGDISCDVDGAIEITYKATDPGNAFYTYLPDVDQYHDGIIKDGLTIMAVDNLPCEFPKDSSEEFSKVLKNFVPQIAKADFNKPFDELNLPLPIKKALILHKGELTKDYLYLNKLINKV